jgi:GTPase SAR1 family protein
LQSATKCVVVHALISDVLQILIGNKCDMLDKKVRALSYSIQCPVFFLRNLIFILTQVIDTARGQALADEYGIKFFETSAKNNINVEKAFFEMAREVLKRLMEQDAKDGHGPVVKLPNSDAEKKPSSCKC